MKAVVDVNILLQSLGKSSRFRPIWDAYINERFNLIISTPILLEYEEKVAEKTTENIARNVMALITEAVNTDYVIIYYEWNAINKDPDDNKYFDTAVSGDADSLVTNDRHFNEVKQLGFPKVNIISGEDFLRILTNR